jgi:hypothetical protein
VQRARQELRQFERGLARGVEDNRQFNSMVSAVHDVISRNTMSEYSRQSLVNDLRRIQDWWYNYS